MRGKKLKEGKEDLDQQEQNKMAFSTKEFNEEMIRCKTFEGELSEKAITYIVEIADEVISRKFPLLKKEDKKEFISSAVSNVEKIWRFYKGTEEGQFQFVLNTINSSVLESRKNM